MVVLLLQTGLNIMSVVFIKKHLKAKRNLFIKKRINNMLPIDEKSNTDSISKTVENITQADQNLSIMVVILTVLSSFEHIFLISQAIIFNYLRDDTAYLFALLADFSISIKHFSNIILYFLFNKLFKIELINLFKCKH